MTIPSSRMLGRYQLLDVVGTGRLGPVYRAVDYAGQREVAVRVLPDELARDPTVRAGFAPWAALLAGLRHPNLMPVLEYGGAGDALYLVMPYVRGISLKEFLQRGRLPYDGLAWYAQQLAGALDALHAQGLVHRNVKPSNVLIDERGHLFLHGYGLVARADGAGALMPGAKAIGSFTYMAPETAHGRGDARVDLYALGAIVYEMLAGRPPFQGASRAEVLMRHLYDPVPLVPLYSAARPVPAAALPVLQRALAKQPAERYRSGHDLVLALAQALGLTGAPPPATTRPPATPSSPPAPSTDPERRLLIIAGALLAALICLLILIAIAVILVPRLR